jgi:hypothetical protein
MEKTLEELESRRKDIYRQLEKLGDFRQGTISATYRKCGKKTCVCTSKDHPGHGPQYLWTTVRKGKKLVQYLRLGPELDQVQKQVEEGRVFGRWYEEVMNINEQICRERPVLGPENEKELTALKKKLQRSFLRKRKKKSIV